MKNIKKELFNIIASYFKIKKSAISCKTQARDIKDWDSFAQINIILSIEKKFKISINSKELLQMENVGDTLAVIIKKINDKSKNSRKKRLS